MENKVINKIQEKLKNNCMEYKSFPIKARELEKYNSLYPKAAKIILQDFERMSINKVEYQKRSLEAKIKMDKLAQWQGFIVCLFMVIGAVICGYLKQEITASILVSVSAIGLVKAILPTKQENDNNGRSQHYLEIPL